MVLLVRHGHSQRSVARRFRVSLHTVQRWVERAGTLPLKEVDWGNRSKTAHQIANKTSADLEQEVCLVRKQLETTGALGFTGAQAIQDALRERAALSALPSVRTMVAFSDAKDCWMASGEYGVWHLHRVGICPAWLSNWRSWIVSMWWKICGWKTWGFSNSLPPGHCGAPWPKPGPHKSPRRLLFSKPCKHIGSVTVCRPSPSSTTMCAFKADIIIRTLSASHALLPGFGSHSCFRAAFGNRFPSHH